jgi:hypothetical protein
MLAVSCHDWPTRPETQASTPERSGRVKSSRAGGEHILKMNLTDSGELGAAAIPWPKQILKVFIRGLTQHNGHILKVLWVLFLPNRLVGQAWGRLSR